MLEHVQRGLMALYDLELGASVREYLCDAETVRAAAGAFVERGEVLLVLHEPEGASVGLYVDPAAVESLSSESPWSDLQAWCLATEGVSHFVYYMFRADHDHGVSQLELELQAEVDKYATALLAGKSSLMADPPLGGQGAALLAARSRALRHALFEDCSFLDDHATEAGGRYRLASQAAGRYAAWLERVYIDTQRLSGLAAELRRFYRLGAEGKLRASDA